MKPFYAILIVLLAFGSHFVAVASPVEMSSVNQTIYARSFGFSTRAKPLANTRALQKISAHINKMGGGVTLVFAKGTYRVGNETFAGSKGKRFAYIADSLLKLTGCTKPVIIEGNGAVIKLADGLHFGSFNPETGAIHTAPDGGFTNYDYTAYPGNIFDFRNNASITVRNIILDGNVQKLVLGGYWGDKGIQLPADGFYGFNNGELTLEKVTGRYCGRDGVHIGNETKNASAPLRKINLINSVFDGNTRQGFSWVGGNHLNAVNTQFINTGKTISARTKAAVRSAPAAGVDMEAELGVIRNGVFTNCTIYNNGGVGLLTVGDVGNVAYDGGKIIGSTNWSIYGSGPGARFSNTLIVGSLVNLRTGKGPTDPENALFENCRITLDPAYSPSKEVYGKYVLDFGGGAGGHFKNCTIDSHVRGTVYGGSGCVFTDCVFLQEPTAKGFNGYPFMSGTFYGINRWYRPGKGAKLGNGSLGGLDKSTFHGPFYVNDTEIGTGKKASK